MLSVKLDRHSMDRYASRMLGRPVLDPIRFHIELGVSGAGASWRGVLEMAVNLLMKPGDLVQRPLITAEVEQALYSTLLLTQPHNYTGDLLEPLEAAREPRAVRTTRELIESMPHLPHT